MCLGRRSGDLKLSKIWKNLEIFCTRFSQCFCKSELVHTKLVKHHCSYLEIVKKLHWDEPNLDFHRFL